MPQTEQTPQGITSTGPTLLTLQMPQTEQTPQDITSTGLTPPTLQTQPTRQIPQAGAGPTHEAYKIILQTSLKSSTSTSLAKPTTSTTNTTITVAGTPLATTTNFLTA